VPRAGSDRNENSRNVPMNSTRREFLQRTGLTTAGLLLAPRFQKTVAQEGSPTAEIGLLWDAADLPRIKETLKLPRFQPFWKTLVEADRTADRTFLTDELKLNNHVAHFLRARQILERESFAYAVTGDTVHSDLALLALDRMLAYKKWDYFLEAGEATIGLQRAPEATIAVVSAREWLDDRLTPALKAEMEKQIAEKGAPACYRTLYGLKYPERVRGWSIDPETDYQFRFDLARWPLILNSTNLKVIPIAGLAMAGCLLYGRHPQAESWINMALQSARAFSSMFGSDGSYDEGVGYWGYTLLHLTLAVEVLRRRLGIDERKIINFPGTVRYGMAMSMPTQNRPNDCVNFGDAWQMGDVSPAAWVARQFRDGLAQHMATTVGTIANHYAAIWYDPSVAPARPPAALQDVRLVNDVVVSRTGWDSGASVLALRSGGPANHEHADRNSIVFAAFGERLLHDPYKAAYSHTEPNWLLRQTAAHTALLIDGKGHQYHDGREGTNASWAEAHVDRYVASDERMVVTSDATQAYRLVFPDVTLVQRTLLFVKPDILVVLDRVRFGADPHAVQLRFQVDNSDGKGTATAGASTFRIVRPGASLQGWISGECSARAAALELPEKYGLHPFVEILSPAAKEHTLLTVCTVAPTAESHGTITAARDEQGWRLSGAHRGRTIRARIGVTTDIPEVTL
jgi:hypothetical protein